MSMPDTVRVRFAPSPTGSFHVGGARTALFNWALRAAPQGRLHPAHRGHRPLALDRRAHRADHRRAALARPRLGRGPAGTRLSADRALRRSTARTPSVCCAEGARLPLPLRARHARRRCARPPEARKETFRYPGTCREADVPESEPHALRLRDPAERPDGGRRRRSTARVGFDNDTLDDWILVRTDGTPDLQLLRGGGRRHHEDHPRHPRQRPPVATRPSRSRATARRSVTVPPVFAHIPMILGARPERGCPSVTAPRPSQAFRDQGILPEAMRELPGAPRLVPRRPGNPVARRARSEHFDLEHVGTGGRGLRSGEALVGLPPVDPVEPRRERLAAAAGCRSCARGAGCSAARRDRAGLARIADER